MVGALDDSSDEDATIQIDPFDASAHSSARKHPSRERRSISIKSVPGLTRILGVNVQLPVGFWFFRLKM